jgi:hypothetical protein
VEEQLRRREQRGFDQVLCVSLRIFSHRYNERALRVMWRLQRHFSLKLPYTQRETKQQNLTSKNTEYVPRALGFVYLEHHPESRVGALFLLR